MSTGSVSSTGSTSTQNSTATDGFNALQPGDFMKMLMAELQHQDPMNPMDNSQLLQEVSQIKQIASNEQLSSTLQSVLLGQNLAAASSLLRQTITGLGASGNTVTGQVQSVTIQNGAATLNLGADTVDLKNVTGIQPAGASG
jgi:flagellar basal-body rod modification protein FlgD